MSEPPPDGITAIRARMTRASRKPPRPRGADATLGSAPGASVPDPASVQLGPAPAPEPAPAPARAPRATRARAGTRPVVPADAPPVNLALRVRRPLDDHLAEVIHVLRGRGVRTSKVELVEMLLWEMPGEPEAVLARLAAFRAHAPRPAQAPLPQP